MKKLNLHSTLLFLRLLRDLGTSPAIHHNIRGHYPFTITRLEPVDNYGYKGTLYSLMQTYTRPGTDGRDIIFKYPEMTFIVVDNRTQRSQSPKRVFIYPARYIQKTPDIDVDQESVIIESGVVTDYRPDWQADQRTFAHQWLKDLLNDGFIH